MPVERREPKRNKVVRWIRTKGDVQPPLAAQLLDNRDEIVDLSTATSVKFRLVNQETGVAKVDNQNAAIDSAAQGHVSYTPSANDVDTAGTFVAYFLVTFPGAPDPVRYPYDGARWLLDVVEETESE